MITPLRLVGLAVAFAAVCASAPVSTQSSSSMMSVSAIRMTRQEIAAALEAQEDEENEAAAAAEVDSALDADEADDEVEVDDEVEQVDESDETDSEEVVATAETKTKKTKKSSKASTPPAPESTPAPELTLEEIKANLKARESMRYGNGTLASPYHYGPSDIVAPGNGTERVLGKPVKLANGSYVAELGPWQPIPGYKAPPKTKPPQSSGGKSVHQDGTFYFPYGPTQEPRYVNDTAVQWLDLPHKAANGSYIRAYGRPQKVDDARSLTKAPYVKLDINWQGQDGSYEHPYQQSANVVFVNSSFVRELMPPTLLANGSYVRQLGPLMRQNNNGKYFLPTDHNLGPVGSRSDRPIMPGPFVRYVNDTAIQTLGLPVLLKNGSWVRQYGAPIIVENARDETSPPYIKIDLSQPQSGSSSGSGKTTKPPTPKPVAGGDLWNGNGFFDSPAYYGPAIVYDSDKDRVRVLQEPVYFKKNHTWISTLGPFQKVKDVLAKTGCPQLPCQRIASGDGTKKSPYVLGLTGQIFPNGSRSDLLPPIKEKDGFYHAYLGLAQPQAKPPKFLGPPITKSSTGGHFPSGGDKSGPPVTKKTKAELDQEYYTKLEEAN